MESLNGNTICTRCFPKDTKKEKKCLIKCKLDFWRCYSSINQYFLVEIFSFKTVLTPIGAQGVTMSVCLVTSCLDQSIFIIHTNQSLKYCVLLILKLKLKNIFMIKLIWESEPPLILKQVDIDTRKEINTEHLPTCKQSK